MSYRITYGKNVHKTQISTGTQKLAKRLTALGTALILLFGIGWIGWSNQSIRNWFLPGDPQVTEIALQELIADIQRGESISDAVTAFCSTIIESANYQQ